MSRSAVVKRLHAKVPEFQVRNKKTATSVPMSKSRLIRTEVQT